MTTSYAPARNVALTADEELALVGRAKAGDKHAINTLCQRFDGFIQSRVERLAKSANPTLRADVLQEARIGFLHAIGKYDASTGYRLSTYARSWIDTAVRDSYNEANGRKKLVTTPMGKRVVYNHERASQKARRLLAGTIDSANRTAHRTLVADLIGVNLAAVERFERHRTSLSLDAPIVDGEAGVVTFADILPSAEEQDPAVLVAAELDRDRLAAQMVQALAKLPPRSASIVQDRVLSDEPRTLESLSKRWGVSRERVRQIEEKALEQLRRPLANMRHLVAA